MRTELDAEDWRVGVEECWRAARVDCWIDGLVD
jgi:hypothetical protein